MNRRRATILLAGVVVAVLFGVIATGGSVRYVEQGPSFARRPADDGPLTTLPPIETTEIEFEPRQPLEIPGFIEVIFQSVLLACVAALAVLLLWYAWRNRPRLRWRRRRSPDFEVLDDVAAAISADAAEQRAALQRGEARNAIVECWLRLERSVTDAGVRRDPADTSAELTERVLSQYAVDPTAIRRLAGLYREARFSTHEMGEPAREQAIEALDAVHDGLRHLQDDEAEIAKAGADR